MTNKIVKKKSGHQLCDPEVGARLRKLRREKLQSDQKDFARLLGVSQATVSQWERGDYLPSPMALMAIGKLAGDDRDWWFEKAGPEYLEHDQTIARYKKTWTAEGDENRTVLVFGTAGAGPFRLVPEEAEAKVSLPRAWLGPSSGVVGLRVLGDSLSPLIESNYIVFVDTTGRPTSEHLDHLVAVTDGEGVTIKYLRRMQGKMYLVPHNLTVDNPVLPFTAEMHLVGRVIGWLNPPKPDHI